MSGLFACTFVGRVQGCQAVCCTVKENVGIDLTRITSPWYFQNRATLDKISLLAYTHLYLKDISKNNKRKLVKVTVYENGK